MPTRRRSALPLLALALSLFATLAAAGEPKPARIVSTTPSVTGILLAMDAPLVASAATTPSRLTDAKGFFSQWAKVADQRGVEVLYRNLRFDIEAVIAQDPDLLVASATGADSAAPYRAELEAQGVPTLVVDYSKHSWQELATELGRHTGLERQAQAAIQRFDAYTAEVAAAIAPPQGPVSVVGYNIAGSYSIGRQASPQARLLEALGFQVAELPEALAGKVTRASDFQFISRKNLPAAIAGDSVFLLGASDDDVQAFLADPVLANLSALALGSRPVPLAVTLDALQAVDPHDDRHLVVRELRLPRTLVALLAGAALGVAGALMQALTRNPLAEPGLLGINAGAALAVIVGVALFDLASMGQYLGCAFLGAGLAGIAVFLLGQARETGTNPVRLVLAGAGLSVMLASLTGIIVLNAPPEVFDRFRHWAAGSLSGSGFALLGWPGLAIGAGLAAAFALAARLNALALGQEIGRALGVDLRLTWLLACLAVMLLAGAATALAGPIAFVGLVAPHLARLLAGPDQRWILPFSALIAAGLLLGADILGRLLAAPAEIAAGIVALLLGGPAFIVLVRRFRLSRL